MSQTVEGTEIVRDLETTREIMQRILSQGIVPFTPQLISIWNKGLVAFVGFEMRPFTMKAWRTLFPKWNKRRDAPVIGVSGKEYASRVECDPVTRNFLVRERTDDYPVFLFTGEGTLLLNFHPDRGFSIEPGSTDDEYLN